MCLDIDRESVIHKHLVKKIYDLFENTADDQGYNSVLKNLNGSSYEGYSKHHLTMLPSFHISLGEPPQTKNEHKIFKKCEANELRHIDIVPLIGDITLAPICISKNGKKSAWIPIHPYWIQKYTPINSYQATTGTTKTSMTSTASITDATNALYNI